MPHNLLGNAWKFTAKQVAAVIEFGRAEHEGQQAYFVRDDGAGFDMRYAGKLFTPFQRLHQVSAFAGTGIGLATVQRIVSRHDGKVWARRQVDNGATFYFTLGESSRPPRSPQADSRGRAHTLSVDRRAHFIERG